MKNTFTRMVAGFVAWVFMIAFILFIDSTGINSDWKRDAFNLPFVTVASAYLYAILWIAARIEKD